MGIEFEVRKEGYSQYTGSPFQGQYGVVQSDSRIRVMVDFGAEMAKPRSSAQSSIIGERAERASAI